MIRKLSIYVALILASANFSIAQVVINEFLASNKANIVDPDYNLNSDWIELYNTGLSSVDIGGYTISDDPLTPALWTVPLNTVIPSHGYVLLWADGENTGLHTNFKLSAAGESIIFTNPDGVVADEFIFGAQTNDVSMGRMPNGTGNFAYFDIPTPGAANGTAGLIGIAPEPVFSVASGFYSSKVSVQLSTSLAGSTIRYTTNGSEPTATSTAYSSTISISKNTVLRARVFHDRYSPSRILSQTYFVGERTIDIPVVSLAVDPVAFFDPVTGMYVKGPNAQSAEPYYGANFWANREEPVSFEYYDKSGIQQLQVNAGIKIFGGFSRSNNQRSFTIVCRESRYGDDRMHYKFFEEKDITSFKSIVLRNAGNDNGSGMMRDAAMQTMIAGQLDLEYLGYQPSAVFINGEYWGILNIREKINEHYVENNTGINQSDAEVLSAYMDPIARDSLHYRAMFDFARTHDLSVMSNYRYMETQMDMDNYIDYLIAEIYFANADWPDNNIKYFRKSGYGGRWRWILFDLDFGLGIWGSSSSANGFPHAFGSTLMPARTWSMPAWGTMLNENLIVNEEFKNKLIQRFSYHLDNTFESARTTAIIARLSNVIKKEMPFHKTRWNGNMYSWDVDNMNSWAISRPDRVKSHLRSYFELGDRFTLSVSGSGGLQSIKVSGMNVLSTTFSHSFFAGVPIYLEAIPAPGYRFSHWENAAGAAVGTRLQYTAILSGNTSLKAVFVVQPMVSGIYINEVLPSNKSIMTDENGQFEDIIELYNAGTLPVNVGGLYLSDRMGMLTKWMLPTNNPELTTIPAKGFLIIYADNDSLHGPLHANFKLSAVKDSVFLSQISSKGVVTILDQITFANVIEDVSYGHFPDGSGQLDAFITPTLGSANMKNTDVVITGLYINEFLATNHNTIQSPLSEFSDWIEIYNSNSVPVNVGGLYLTDNLDNPFKSRIPITTPLLTTIPAKGYLLIWADSKTSPNAVHVDFRISSAGGYLALNQKTATGANMLSGTLYTAQVPDVSYGLIPNGGSSYKKLLKPTPGTTNVDAAYRALKDLVINEVQVNNTKSKADETGVFAPWIELHYSGASIVNIAGVYITDDAKDPYKYTITRLAADKTTLSAGDKFCLWADSLKSKGLTHLNFALAPAGGILYLFQYDGTKAVEVGNFTYTDAGEDLSHGRFPDGSENLEVMPPTFSADNVSSSSIAYLTDLVAESGLLLPEFAQDQFEYTVSLNPGTTAVPLLMASPYSSEQTVTVVQAKNLSEPTLITVLSEDGTHSLTYTVSFSVVQSSDATLRNLALSKGVLVPDFSPDVFSYTASFLGDNIAPVVTAEPTYAGAGMTISQSNIIPGTAVITITAEDGTKKLYTIGYTTGSTVVEGFIEDFNDNFNNGWNDSKNYYKFTEANGELSVKLGTSTDGYRSFKYTFPLKIVDMTNYPYLSLKMKVPSSSTEVRIDLRDSNKFVTNQNEHKVVVKNTDDFVEYYFDYSGRFYQAFPSDNRGAVDYKSITDLVFIFQPGISGVLNKTVIFEDVKIGKAAYKPEYDIRLADIAIEGYVLFPPFTPSIQDYTVILPESVTKTPTVVATAANQGATLSYTPAAKLPGSTRIKVSAELGDTYQYYNVNFKYRPALGCAGGLVFTETAGTFSDGSGDEKYIKSADCYWLIQPRLADTIILSFSEFVTQLNVDKVMIYDGDNTSAPLIATLSGTNLVTVKATSGSMFVHFVSDLYTEMAGWTAHYTTVTKPSSDAGILGVTVKNGVLGQEFSPVESSFLISANNASVVPSIVPTLSDSFGAVYQLQAASAIPGISTLTVTAEDGTVKEYLFHIVEGSNLIKPLPTVAYLQFTAAPNILSQPYVNTSLPISWSVKNSSNVSVFIQDGVFSFISDPTWTGTETVYITASYGDVTDTEPVHVTVTEIRIPIESISIPSTVMLEYPSVYTYLPKMLPANTNEKLIKWHSSNPAAVTVNSLGQIFAVTSGTSTITAYNADSTVFAKSKVTSIVCTDPVTITLNKSVIELVLDGAVQLVADLGPACLTNKELLWTSSNTAVATISVSGVIVPVSVGTAVITVKPKTDQTVSAKCTVHVKEPCLSDPATITASLEKVDIVEGITALFTTMVSPANLCDTVLLYTSSDTKVATVKAGVITAVAKGSAIITITNTTLNTVPAKILVTVLPRTLSVESVSLSKSSLQLVAGSSFLLTADVQPEGATFKDVTWTASNAKATVAKGLVGAIDTGTVIVRVKTADGGFNDSCVVTILPLKATKMIISLRNPQIRVGQVLAIGASFIPEIPTIKDVQWTSRNAKIFTISNTGLITGVSPGNAYVVAKLMDGGNLTDSVLVTVLPLQIDSVVFAFDSVSISVGKTKDLFATVYPLGESQIKPIFMVADKSVISISKTGTVTAIAEGQSYLYVIAGAYSDSCVVVVRQIAAESIAISKTISLAVDDTVRLAVSFVPANTTTRDITWATDFPTVALVDSLGLVTAIGQGVAVITATSSNGKIARCEVSVSMDIIPVEKLTIVNIPEIFVGETFKINLIVKPEDATTTSIIWSSDDQDIISIVNGVITAIAAGEATVSVTVLGITASQKVVIIKSPVSGVVISNYTANLASGTVALATVDVIPATATNKNILWSVSDSTVLKVDNGKYSALSAGTAYLIATSEDSGDADSVLITVKGIALQKLSVGYNSKSVWTASSQQLVPNFFPENATLKTVEWQSSNIAVFKIDQNGLLEAITEGEAWIRLFNTAHTLSDSVLFTAKKRVIMLDSVGLNVSVTSISVGQTVFASAIPFPAGASNATFVYTSSNPAVLSVSQTGIVVGLATGLASVEVKSADGSVTKSVIVQVVNKLTENLVMPESLLLVEGEISTDLYDNITIIPVDAATQKDDIIWIAQPAGIISINGSKITAHKTGTVVVTAISGDKQDTASVTVTVVVNAKPVIKPIPEQFVLRGKSFAPIYLSEFVSDDYTSADKIRWTVLTHDNLLVSIDTNNIATVSVIDSSWIGSERISLIALDAYGKSSFISVQFTVFSQVSELLLSQGYKMELSPNPAENIVTVSAAGFAGATIEIVNSIGDLVSTISMATDLQQIDISVLPAGVYTVKVFSKDAVLSQKLTVY